MFQSTILRKLCALGCCEVRFVARSRGFFQWWVFYFNLFLKDASVKRPFVKVVFIGGAYFTVSLTIGNYVMKATNPEMQPDATESQRLQNMRSQQTSTSQVLSIFSFRI